MDGHDNDADKANGNSETQGIFSTPDLTVDAENITPTASENSRSRVASIFANTDAGQRSQRLNDAMEANTTTFTPATEDIKIDNGPRKHSKAPIIIALIALVAIIGGVVTWLVLQNANHNQTASQNPQDAFSAYREYLERGPELPGDDDNESASNDQWSVFQLSQLSLHLSEQQQYVTTLEKKYDDFLSSLDVSKTSESILNAATDYKKILNLVLQYNTLNLLSDSILNQYIQNGEESAKKYTTELIQSDFADYSLEQISELLSSYVNDEYTLIQFYSYHNCIINKALDYGCVAELGDTNTSYNEVSEQQSNTQYLLNAYRTILKDIFDTKTNTLSTLIKENYA